MNGIVLHTRSSGYMFAAWRELSNRDVTLSVVTWKAHINAPFELKYDDCNFKTVKCRHDFSYEELLAFCLHAKPDFILLAGWSDPWYVKICKIMKSQGILIISGCDNQWVGSFRQNMGRIAAPWYLSKFIDILWVPGERQRQLAARFGYRGERCWEGNYSCDWELFAYRSTASLISDNLESFSSTFDLRNGLSSNAFLYTGRYVSVKGLDTLASAYKKYKKAVTSPWKLICAGKGDLQRVLIDAGATDIGFVQPDDLPGLMHAATAFILPSHKEPWGVVLHEAATSGLPLIATETVGASVHLLRDGWNGYLVETGNVDSLVDAMVKMHNLSSDRIAEMGENSFLLSKQFTPERWARQVVEGIQDWKTHSH